MEDRLSRLIERARPLEDYIIGQKDDFSNYQCSRSVIPAHFQWTVTMWHLGADALIEYSGEKFCMTWETAENVLIRAYSKITADNRTRIRLERQEYPKATLADVIEQKLNRS